MPTDPQILSRLLESGRFDKYVQQYLEQTYGRGSLSPYMTADLVRRAPDTVRRLTAEGLVNQGPRAVSDPSTLEQALQAAVKAEVSGYGSKGDKTTGPRLLELMSQWRNSDPLSEEAIMAEALYNDPATLKSLVLATMPRGYGGAFNKAYTSAIGEGIDNAALAGPEQGDYVTRVARLLSGLTQTPVNVAEPVRPQTGYTNPSQSVLPEATGGLPDATTGMLESMGMGNNTLSALDQITPDELAALRQLAGK